MKTTSAIRANNQAPEFNLVAKHPTRQNATANQQLANTAVKDAQATDPALKKGELPNTISKVGGRFK